MKRRLTTLSDYLRFFKSIPEEAWTVGNLFDYESNKRCAIGLLKCDNTGSYRQTFAGILLGELVSNFRLGTDKISKDYSEYFTAENMENLTSYQIGFNFIAAINDGHHNDYQQYTPKKRIVAFLQDIIERQDKSIKEANEEEISSIRELQLAQ